MRICILSDEEIEDFNPAQFMEGFDWEFVTMRKPVMDSLRSLSARKEFDIYAIFNAFFPNIVPSLANVMDKNVPYKASDPRQLGPKIQQIKDALMQDSITAAQIAKHFDMKLSDLPMSLAFNENVLRDVTQKSGGNPS